MKQKSHILKIDLSGFKSIKKQSISLTQVNVFIGANGAGKSNLISFFALMKSLIYKNFNYMLVNLVVQMIFFIIHQNTLRI